LEGKWFKVPSFWVFSDRRKDLSSVGKKGTTGDDHGGGRYSSLHYLGGDTRVHFRFIEKRMRILLEERLFPCRKVLFDVDTYLPGGDIIRGRGEESFTKKRCCTKSNTACPNERPGIPKEKVLRKGRK